MAEKVTVLIPTPLRGHVDGQARLELAGATVGEVLGVLVDRYPKLRDRLFNERDELNRFLNVFLNDEDVRFLQSLDTPVKDGDGVTLVPAIAGGSDPTGLPGGHRT
ncbi:MAG TPA: ubiquitin-like small modifier protein 1 [Vicinamibacteria bacterium]|nr:ubiquitin-like small modifier protein 1 [Vicinamibacteria bacterium]